MQSFLHAFLSQTDGGATSSPGGGLVGMLPFFAMMIAVFYFIVWRPQGKERKRQQEWLARMQKGEEVVLQSGIVGVIHSVDDRLVVLDVGGGNKLRVLKTQVAGQFKQQAPAQPAKAEAKK
jgi:preprotein translocase subunit YajC